MPGRDADGQDPCGPASRRGRQDMLGGAWEAALERLVMLRVVFEGEGRLELMALLYGAELKEDGGLLVALVGGKAGGG